MPHLPEPQNDITGQALLEALPHAVVLLDAHGTVTACNALAVELLGPSLAGAAWVDVVARAFRGPSGGDLQLNNGPLVQVNTAPVPGGGQVVTLQDVSETRRLQQRLDQVRRLSEIGRMAASLAHQVRTPLATALLYCSQLTSAELSAAQRQRFACKAVERLRHLETLVHDMLAFTRGGAVSGEPVAVLELFRSTEQMLREQPADRLPKITVSIATPGLAVRGNRHLLQSALQNLANNAVQAVGGAAGEVRLYVRQPDAARIELVVEDNGSGVAEAERGRLFEPLHSARKEGNGLGLAVVRSIARGHGGEVWHEAPANGGSRFVLALPPAGVTQQPASAANG